MRRCPESAALKNLEENAPKPPLVCASCKKEMRPHDVPPFGDDSDCGGDCWACVRRVEVASS